MVARKRGALELADDARLELQAVSRSRTEPFRRVERARMLLWYADGGTIAEIVERLGTNRPKVERCVDKALSLGATAALDDLPGRGRKREITEAARAWLVSLACRKPTELGYAQELWTTALLAEHARTRCGGSGHPSLSTVGKGTVSKILSSQAPRPHKVECFLERRDPEFDEKMARVLHVYREVKLLREGGKADGPLRAYLSYDEKPGIQALGATAPDRPPGTDGRAAVGRDPEYVRHGTATLMAGLDLLTGHVHAAVADRHRSREFVDFLRQIDRAYPKQATIRMILDNHSAHVSKETRAYLASVPNRFEFVFTPKHGSWLNLVESFFGKLARTLLRGIRVDSKDELKERILQHLDWLNAAPVVFKWGYRMDDPDAA